MVVHVSASSASIDRIFRAMADPTRRDIVERVLKGEQSVSALADRYQMSFAAVQKHVAVLERAGLAKKHARGRERLVSANIGSIRKVRNLLDRYEALWRDRIDRLDALLAEPEHPSTTKE
ncbi:MAG: metalloregulator ArsR/SmtB family transcription factor [Polyangiaceae bacterium]|nr:metalloregulator ArsR/SmtB family transcription factor [Polyangiaceae bacterium]